MSRFDQATKRAAEIGARQRPTLKLHGGGRWPEKAETCACGKPVPPASARHCSVRCKNRSADKARKARDRKRGAPPRRGLFAHIKRLEARVARLEAEILWELPAKGRP